jgi:hypothetical protein
MPDTTTDGQRPPPTDLATLRRYWLPPAPTDTAVTRAAAVLDRVNTALHSAIAQLDALRRAESTNATALVDAAETGDAELTEVIATINPVDRALLKHRINQLSQAWSLANHRHSAGENDDPEHSAWRKHCDELTDEWRGIMTGDGDDATRLARLTALTSGSTVNADQGGTPVPRSARSA